MGFPLGLSPNGAPWWVGSIVNETRTINIWIFQHKNPKQLVQIKKLKTKRNLSESDSENETADFPRFIVIESLEEVCLAKLTFSYRKSDIYKS